MNNNTYPNLQESNKIKTDKFGAQASKTIDEASDKMESAYGSAKETISDAGKKLSNGYDKASEEIRKASGQFKEVVKKNPMVAVSVAAGLGWAFGRLLSPKGSRDRSH